MPSAAVLESSTRRSTFKARWCPPPCLRIAGSTSRSRWPVSVRSLICSERSEGSTPADMTTPLVTGATGFAGGHLVEHLLEHTPRVAAWGHAGGRHLPAGRDERVSWSAVDVT